MRRKTLLAFAILALLLGACAADEVATDATTAAEAADDQTEGTEADDHADDEAEEDDHADEEADHAFWFGEPADAGDAERVIEIEAADDFTFTPAEVSVAVGETVTFRVVNTGNLPHDFTIGDAAIQDEHDEEMKGGEMHGTDPNAMMIEPGETGELTWTFTESGTILIGCHVPGHYAAGMKGTLEIDA